MLHNKLARSFASGTRVTSSLSSGVPGPSVVSINGNAVRATPAVSPFAELAIITSRRCSSFFAEAAVLVLVFGLLDYFLMKGRMELPWIVGALLISLALLAASILMDFSAHRWIKAHP